MMDLFGLNGYNLEERVKRVQEWGSFITTRPSDRYDISLYHMGHFFAEVWYLKDGDRLVLVRGFEDEAYLESYLQEIDVSELML